jgi:cobalt-zinc-cadmium efflux system outer membrane protein
MPLHSRHLFRCSRGQVVQSSFFAVEVVVAQTIAFRRKMDFEPPDPTPSLRWFCIFVAVKLFVPLLLLAQTSSEQSATRRLEHLPPVAETIAPPVISEPLTLADAEELALARNPSLIRAQAMVNAAQGNWVQVGLPFNPSVGYLGQQLGSGGQSEQHGVLIQQEFIRGHKKQLNRAVAEQEIIAAQQQLAAQEQRVLTDVRLTYNDALLAQRRLELARELLGLARQGVDAVDELRKAGESSRIDQLQAGLEMQSADILVVSAENRRTAALRSLAAVIGVTELPTNELSGDSDVIPEVQTWAESLERLLTNSPEISAAAANIERSRWALQRACAEPIPNITVQGVVMSDNGIGGKTDGIVQLTMPLPLYNRNQGAIQQAQATVVAANHALAQLEMRLQNQLAPVYERYASAANQVHKYHDQILPAAKESLELVRQGHKAGEYPFLNLLTAQRTFFQNNLQYLDALREFRAAAIEIDGLLLRDSQNQ